jgi:hypothetical protein
MSINLWPSKDTFHEFHNNPEYQNFKLLRHDHSDDALIQVAGEDIALKKSLLMVCSLPFAIADFA